MTKPHVVSQHVDIKGIHISESITMSLTSSKFIFINVTQCKQLTLYIIDIIVKRSDERVTSTSIKGNLNILYITKINTLNHNLNHNE